MQLVRPGDIVFHRGRGLQAALIRYATGCPWSHVSLVTQVFSWSRSFNVLDVLHQRTVHAIDWHEDEDEDWHVRSPRQAPRGFSPWYSAGGYPHPITRDHVVRHALELHEHLPKSYPYVELLAYLPVFRRTAAGRRLLNRTERKVCSAMVATAWQAMDFCWVNGDEEEISPDWVDPGVAWRQANRDGWPVVQTKKGYENGL